MIDMLIDCGIFLPVEGGRDNYYQISGKGSRAFKVRRVELSVNPPQARQ
jgi:hypothetical protein